MFTGRKKIVKPEGQTPDEFEEQVAQELFNLEARLPPALRRAGISRDLWEDWNSRGVRSAVSTA